MDVIGPENTFPTLAAGVDAFLLRFHDDQRIVPDEPTAGTLQEDYQ